MPCWNRRIACVARNRAVVARDQILPSRFRREGYFNRIDRIYTNDLTPRVWAISIITAISSGFHVRIKSTSGIQRWRKRYICGPPITDVAGLSVACWATLPPFFDDTRELRVKKSCRSAGIRCRSAGSFRETTIAILM
jgi:hypothetical protein